MRRILVFVILKVIEVAAAAGTWYGFALAGQRLVTFSPEEAAQWQFPWIVAPTCTALLALILALIGLGIWEVLKANWKAAGWVTRSKGDRP